MPGLKRSLSLFDLTMIAVGSTIGSGIFLTPSIVARALPSPLWILGVWMAGGITALCGALTFAELGSMMPRAGGVYVFLTVAFVGVLWSYGGWQHATFTAAEAVNPGRDIPVSLILGAAAVVIVYLLVNLAYMLLLDPVAMAASSHVVSDAVSTRLGAAGATIIAITIFISTFGTAGIYTLTAPRIYFAMARDGLFFRNVGVVHPRYTHRLWPSFCSRRGQSS